MSSTELQQQAEEEKVLENLRREAAIGLEAIEQGDFVELESHEIGDYVRKLGEEAHERLRAGESAKG